MEAARTSETSVDIQWRTRQYIPEDSELLRFDEFLQGGEGPHRSVEPTKKKKEEEEKKKKKKKINKNLTPSTPSSKFSNCGFWSNISCRNIHIFMKSGKPSCAVRFYEWCFIGVELSGCCVRAQRCSRTSLQLFMQIWLWGEYQTS
jgi:hypothetical protein